MAEKAKELPTEPEEMMAPNELMTHRKKGKNKPLPIVLQSPHMCHTRAFPLHINTHTN